MMLDSSMVIEIRSESIQVIEQERITSSLRNIVSILVCIMTLQNRKFTIRHCREVIYGLTTETEQERVDYSKLQHEPNFLL